MFDDHYIGWRLSRMMGIHKYIQNGFFKNKTLLELGCGYGDIGNAFYELGATVTSSDAVHEYLDVVKQKYPHIKTLHIDCDNDDIPKRYDVILHWGVLYHLNNIDKHIKDVSKKCNILLLETEVADSNDDNFYISTHEDGYDQAFNKIGIRPSQGYIEKLLRKNGFEFKLIKDPILNSDFHIYDWEIENSKIWKSGLRRFWICWKDVNCPLI